MRHGGIGPEWVCAVTDLPVVPGEHWAARAASRGPIAAGAPVVTLGPASAADGLLPIAAPAALAAWRQMTSA